MTKMTKLVQESLQLATPDGGAINVEKYEFEPIKGYPMLNWRGKRPFTSTQYYPAQLKEVHGEELDGWRNKIFWGDNLQVMSHLLKQFRGKVNLIYIDPPFDSDAEYKKKVKLKGKDLIGDTNSFEEKQYTDIWSNDEYLQFMFERIVMLRELLSRDGTCVVHVDSSKVHHLRCILDEVFGEKNFKNEIVWYYENKLGTGGNTIDSRHDTLLVYCKGGTQTYNPILLPVKNIKPQPVTQKIDGKRVWLKDENGNNLYQESASERPLGDVWTVPIINPVANERTGYPTQKPEALLENVIRLWSKPNDLVFDCFMGSGTTQAVAMKLGRCFIGADINLGAIQTTTKRLIGVADDLRQKPLNDDVNASTGFEVYNVNHYDVFRNPVQAKELLIEALEVQKLEFSTVFDGEKDGRMVKIMPVNRIATRADLNELIHNFDQKVWQHRHNEHPNRPVEKITLVCMGHEPDLAAQLELAAKPFKIDVEVVDILRDKADLEFKRDSQAKLAIKKGELIIEKFYPMNLLQKLSLQKESVENWKELVESVLIDWNYDGAVLQPAVVDIPGKDDLVKGAYKVPADAGTIRVKITDLLSESWEGSTSNGD
ncbi:site-specific DNA-methyltransferase [Ralstonia pseudosolanacearum]|uniref:site-specific DNA-methyltransferase n=1 Tax=Ralstonia pseudosolanacearum TaxID=1310165 RepID=UPI00201E6BAF|nr:site-specific DNA-methyltransferase [Ralstonia pseudosolanacearum]UQY83027.1 site-specific DNA-methyltransferase [Ralstonia pseudosolanacearum]